MPSQSRLSDVYYRRSITTTDGTDITGDSVAFAFVARDAIPVTGDWHGATYEGANVWQVLVGPNGVALSAATYDVWQKLTDSPEVLAELVDVLEVL